MGSSINSSVLKEKAHPSVNNMSLLIANLIGQYIIIIILIGRTNSVCRMKYLNDLHLSRKKIVLDERKV